jgi:hypothetical protein
LLKEIAVYFGEFGGYFFLLFQSSSITITPAYGNNGRIIGLNFFVARLDKGGKACYNKSIKKQGAPHDGCFLGIAKRNSCTLWERGGYFFLLFQSSSITMKVSIEITKVQKLSTSSIILCIRLSSS